MQDPYMWFALLWLLRVANSPSEVNMELIDLISSAQKHSGLWSLKGDKVMLGVKKTWISSGWVACLPLNISVIHP